MDIRAGKISLVEEGAHASNMVYVDNAVEAVRQALVSDNAAGEVFFITDDVCTWREIFGAYAGWLGRELRSATLEDIRSRIHPTWGQRAASFVSDIWHGVLVPSVRYTAFRAAVCPTLGPRLSRLWQKVPTSMRYRIVGDPLGRSVPSAAALGKTEDDPYPTASLLELYAGRGIFSNEKAKRLLGFGPKVSRIEALERTRQWAEWARLTDRPDE